MLHTDIHDLRSAMKFLQRHGGGVQVIEDELSVDCQIAQRFAVLGGGVPVKHNPNPCLPTIFARPREGGMPVLTGLFGRRADCAKMIGLDPENVARDFGRYIDMSLPPVLVDRGACQENIVLKDIDLRRILPILTLTPQDAGPYITMGVIHAADPETGEEDITIHRLCVQSADEMTVYFVPGRHIETFYLKARRKNQPLPITINIGVDPAVTMAACFTYPTCPLGCNELHIAGAIRGRAVEMVRAVTSSAKAIAHAEIVIEAEIMPDDLPENAHTSDGYALPEFLGYIGRAKALLPRVRVKAITHRNSPIYQTLIGPGAEQSNILGMPTEASLYQEIHRAVTNKLTNVYASHSGAGKLLAFLQFKKTSSSDDALVRQAGIAAFSAFHELKHVFLLDDDVNIFDEREVMWALTTRFQGDKSIIAMSNLNGHPLDPSQSPEFSSLNSLTGTTCKTVFDCTAPYAMSSKFERAAFDGRR
ncbi:MAG: 3-polyprenyl-4-hydroxybenzoate carboxy-lyase [Myxococcaceae bacterium]|nr:3-polyprenyl-4-hydroxybenzoate carboxy-lyase [Myxococcaceae bacterium]